MFRRVRRLFRQLAGLLGRRRRPVSGMTFGLPEEWRDFEGRHARFLQSVLPRLMETATRVFVRTLETSDLHERLAFMLGRHVPEDFNEIFVLAANGYGIGALKLLRPMYERVITMMYLLRNPDKAQDFVYWHAVEKHKFLNHLKDEGDEPRKYLTAEEIEQIKADFERVKDRYPKRLNSWTALDLKSMARKVGVAKLYLSFCYWPTLQIHTTAIGMTARMMETAGKISFKEGPTREEADLALLGGHACLLLALEDHIRHFGLSVDLAALFEDYRAYWDRPAPAIEAAENSGADEAGTGEVEEGVAQ